ncbi:NtaA/DmoA family FMN-dependent monooxygenase [Paenibacillus massiliensis]|uniref:NtaA/DmoA family FMN-dependent monooxygenase n=1 Tax=Paenibacillus massiliensis TaxID=225917 RepID=UPI000471A4D3|nr:NtaA/DmoA family FMN-dependent monooxygenase [Paenibacillus massiliensis]
MKTKHMTIGVAMADFYGSHPNAWRSEETDPLTYINIDEQIKYAKIAENGGLDYIFMPDRVFLHLGFTGIVNFPIDSIVQLSAIAAHTKHIGLIPTLSTSFNEPYTIARQLRALDLISKGRVGWQVVPSFEPHAFANYGQSVPNSRDKYERLHEVVQITQALWGSWKKEAGEPNQETGVFLNNEYIQPINLQGKYVGARGPLQAPPSPQGQPILVMPAASNSGIQPAGMYADAIIGMPNTIKESVRLREIFRSAAQDAGRNADEIKFMTFFTFGLGKTRREALDRRRAMENPEDLPERLRHLSMLLGVPLSESAVDEPLTSNQLRALQQNPHVNKSTQAIRLAKEGYSPLDIIAHGVLDNTPGVVGTAEDVADYLEEWFEAGAADSFVIIADRLSDALSDFVNQVIPVLQERGLRPENYMGNTLRENMNLDYQLGVDPRILNESDQIK